MKLATLKRGGRDGTLVVVNRALTHCRPVPHIARTLQAALDAWEAVVSPLRHVYAALNSGAFKDSEDFDPAACHSPLPRAYQWADGSAYVNHVELVRRARGAELPPEFWSDPLMYQGGSDSFVGPRDPVFVLAEEWGIDLEGEVAVITGDVNMGAAPAEAAKAIRLLLLVNDVSLRNLIPDELAKGFGFLQSKPRSALSPVLVTPDELDGFWEDSTLHRKLITHIDGQLFGQPDAGTDMQFNFAQLVAHAAKTRNLTAGTVVGSGTVANQDEGVGASCLAEKRMLEVIRDGKPSTPFLRYGQSVRIEMLDDAGNSLFGAIEQQIVRYTPRP